MATKPDCENLAEKIRILFLNELSRKTTLEKAVLKQVGRPVLGAPERPGQFHLQKGEGKWLINNIRERTASCHPAPPLLVSKLTNCQSVSCVEDARRI